MGYDNEAVIKISAKSQNEAFARVAVASFISQLDPLVSDITDIKTAVSEAVTNAIIHGYENPHGKEVTLVIKTGGDDVYIEVIDNGNGISNVDEARQPLFTSKPEMERSGMGFTIMETFMDSVEVFSKQGEGTKIIMTKRLSR